MYLLMQKGLLRNICLWLHMIQTGGIKLMWTCNSNKKPSPDKRSNSQILRWKILKEIGLMSKRYLKKQTWLLCKLISPTNIRKPSIKILIHHLHLHWGMCCYCKIFTVTGEMRNWQENAWRSWKMNSTALAQRPNRARKKSDVLWRLCISWPNTDNREQAPQ